MVNINLLKRKIAEREKNVACIAEYIGIDKATLYRKLSKPDNFTIGEVAGIADALSLSVEEINDIFFTNVVA